MPIPLSAAEVLDREFLDLRAKLIDAASILDRLERAEGTVAEDPRLQKVRKSLDVLAAETSERAEQIQLIFSLPYEKAWREEFARQ